MGTAGIAAFAIYGKPSRARRAFRSASASAKLLSNPDALRSGNTSRTRSHSAIVAGNKVSVFIMPQFIEVAGHQRLSVRALATVLSRKKVAAATFECTPPTLLGR